VADRPFSGLLQNMYMAGSMAESMAENKAKRDALPRYITRTVVDISKLVDSEKT
jgi:5-methylthioribose kinase